MKKVMIVLALLLSFIAGASAQRTYFGVCTRDLANAIRKSDALMKEEIIPLDESSKVAALRATVDTLWLVRSLDANGTRPEDRSAAYGEELVGRLEDVRDLLNSTDAYANEYAVLHAFERANKMLTELGRDTYLDPYE